MAAFVQRHYLILLYTLLYAGILFGVVVISGADYLPHLAVYAASLYIAYPVCNLLVKRFANEQKLRTRLQAVSLPDGAGKRLALVALFGVIGAILLQYLVLGGIPVLEALKSVSYEEIIDIRNSVSLAHPLLNYVASFLIRAIIPFLMVYFYVKGKRWLFYLFLLISVFYAISLLQKNYVLMVLFPLVFFTFLKFRWLHFLLLIIVIAVGIGSLVVVTNPALRSEKAVIQTEHTEAPAPTEVVQAPKEGSSKLMLITQAVGRRVFVVPGEIVAKWFDAIPEKKPFLNGCGYRFLTPVLDCEFRNYAKELYPVIHPTRAEQGLEGTVNAAHFMYDFANFGIVGLILSGIILALVLQLVQVIFSGEFFYGLIFNAFFILMLSSSALTTLLFSGGWMLMIVLFFLFRRTLSSSTAAISKA